MPIRLEIASRRLVRDQKSKAFADGCFVPLWNTLCSAVACKSWQEPAAGGANAPNIPRLLRKDAERVITQTFTSNINGMLVKLSCDPYFELRTGGMFAMLACEEGGLYDGWQMQSGWNEFFLEAADGGYVLKTPDYARDPAKRTDDLTNAFVVLAMQNHVLSCCAAKERSVWTTFRDTLTACNDALEAAKVCMVRVKSERAGDSGWRLYPAGGKVPDGLGVDDGTVIESWRLLKKRSVVLALLAMPYGSRAVLNHNRLVEVFDENNRRFDYFPLL